MANKGLKRQISCGAAGENSIEANAAYERGDKVKSKLYFEFTAAEEKKIRLLKIRFNQSL